ncbi:hypothetical protein MASR1M8_00660 [Thermomonas brevis]
MRSLYVRSQDLLKLKAPYRYGICLFSVGGLVTGFLVATQMAYQLQISWGLTPGAPVGSEPGNLQFLALSLVALLGLGLVGMALGLLLLCVLLSASMRMTFRSVFRALFLSYYPEAWFGEKPAT